nr:hypothetical protein [Bacillus cereus]
MNQTWDIFNENGLYKDFIIQTINDDGSFTGKLLSGDIHGVFNDITGEVTFSYAQRMSNYYKGYIFTDKNNPALFTMAGTWEDIIFSPVGGSGGPKGGFFAQIEHRT